MLGALFLMIAPSKSLTVSGSLNFDEDPVSWEYSSDLIVGFETSWTVTESSYFNGSAVTERDDYWYKYLTDDVLSAEIIGNMSEYDPFDYFFDAEAYVTFEMNSEEVVFYDMFIMPIEGTWANGTTGNFIEIYYTAEEGYYDPLHSIKIEGGEVIMKVDVEEKIDLFGIQLVIIQHEQIRYDLATGVLNYYYRESNFIDDQILEIVREGYTAPPRPAGGSDDAPFASLWFIAIGVLAVPVIARLRRKD